jgi:hypothetical protein
MTGYVKYTKKEFTDLMNAKREGEIEVYVVNGGQQTRGIQSAMLSNNDVKAFRERSINYPTVTLYAGSMLEDIDFHTVTIC